MEPRRVMVLATLSMACQMSTGPVGDVVLDADTVIAGLTAPLYVTAPTGDARLFVVEQPGRIRIVEDGALRSVPFLDISSRVGWGGERGLLSLAFHPQYASNGLLYVDYTDKSGNTRVERYQVSGDPGVADTNSATLILGQPQPFANHNGGLIVFGPDGFLYVGLGDGGSGGDPQGNGQNRGTLLGKLLRIDVDHGDPYAIPPDNPFVGQTGLRGEIWAYGLRNPWRFAFDRAAGMLYIADVGQNRFEEVNVAPASAAGLDYGWNILEGTECYGAATCNRNGLTEPILTYGRSDGCSVTGGYVYRGDQIPALRGHYFYSDYCDGWIRSFRYDGAVRDGHDWRLDHLGQVTSFGEDAAGELYVTTAEGVVYRLVAR